MAEGKSYIVWYNSKSHGKTRFFVGTTKFFHGPGCPGHERPTWDYDKTNATVFPQSSSDGMKEAQYAKQFAEMCGYQGLVIEPIDEEKAPAKKVEETVH